MPTTTNYGWTTPADTDLVKDGASAIRTLGNSIDSTLKTQIDAQIPDSIVTTKGDLISATAASTPARIGVGTNGQVLTADSTQSTGLAWTTISSGGMTLISTATPSAATTISFTSIPTTYKQLYLVWNLYHSSATDYLYVRLNNDFGGNYNAAGIEVIANTIASNTNVSVTGFGDTNQLAIVGYSNSAGNSHRHKGFMTIQRANEAVDHQVNWQNFGRVSTGQVYGAIATGIYNGTAAAVTRLDFIRSGTQTITGTVQLYGVS